MHQLPKSLMQTEDLAKCFAYLESVLAGSFKREARLPASVTARESVFRLKNLRKVNS